MSRPQKKQRLGNDAGNNDNELIQLIRHLSREQLEGFVKDAVSSGALDVDALWNAIPETAAASIRRSRSPLVVREAPERKGTGLFDMVPDVTFGHILSFLPLPMKIMCVTCVCRPWNHYKTTIPGLFTDLSEQLAKTEDVSSKFNKIEFCQTLLLQWIPDPTCIQSLRLSMSKECDPRRCAVVINHLQDLKIAAEKKGTPFRLKKLVLQGHKFTPDILKRLVKHGITSSLTSLIFDDIKKSTKLGTENAIPRLLENCPMLEELVIPQYLMGDGRPSLACHLRQISVARSGAPILLTVLDLTHSDFGWGEEDALDWMVLSQLGTYLPALQVLKLMKVTSGTPVQSSPNAPVYTPASPSLEQFLPEPFVPMPNLKVFCLKEIHYERNSSFELYPRYATTPYVSKILARLMEAMPALQDLTFGHGSHGYLSKKKKPLAILPPLPQVDFSAVFFPARLTKVSLDCALPIDPTQFCAFFGNELEHFQFSVSSEAAVALLLQKYPRLQLYRYTPGMYSQAQGIAMCLTSFAAKLPSSSSGKWELVNI